MINTDQTNIFKTYFEILNQQTPSPDVGKAGSQ